MPWPALLGAIALLGAGVGLCVWGFRKASLARVIAATPTQKIRSAAMGDAELKGLAKPLAEPLKAPFSGDPCVWYRFLVEEEREYTDSKGRSRRSWHQVASFSSEVPFLLDDGTGSLRVDPDGAEVDAPKMLSYTSGGLFAKARPAGPRVDEFLGPSGVAGMVGAFLYRRRRLSEWRVDVQRPLYALGVLRPRRIDGGDAVPVLGKGRAGEAYLISTRDEAEILRGLRWASFGLWLLGTLFGLAGLYVARRAGLI